MNSFDFENLVRFKNHLCLYPLDKLKQIYSDETLYREMLYIIHELLFSFDEDTLNVDAFIYLDDDIVDKLYNLIQIHRFDLGEKVSEVVNDIIIYLNVTTNISDDLKYSTLNEFVKFQESIRGIRFNSLEMLKESIAYDAIFLDMIKSDNIDFLLEHDYSILSINYFLNEKPDVFSDYEFYFKSLFILKSFESQGFLLKHYSKKSLKLLEKI